MMLYKQVFRVLETVASERMWKCTIIRKGLAGPKGRGLRPELEIWFFGEERQPTLSLSSSESGVVLVRGRALAA